MRRGFRVALVVGVVVIAAGIAGVCAIIIAFFAGVGMRAAHWHGSVPPLTSRENSTLAAYFLGTFAGVFGVELALLGAGVLLMRYFRRAAEAAGLPAPRPRAIAIIQGLLLYKGLTSVVLLLYGGSVLIRARLASAGMPSSHGLTFTRIYSEELRHTLPLPLVLLAVFVAARATIRWSPKSRMTLLVGIGVLALHAVIMLATALAHPGLYGGAGLAWPSAVLWLAVTYFVAKDASIASYLSSSGSAAPRRPEARVS